MIYLRSILTGILSAVVVAGLWIVATVVMPLLIPLLLSRGTGSGGIGAVSIGSGSILVAGLVGFVAGFYWQFRRLSNRRMPTR